jgi:hypothetical protein
MISFGTSNKFCRVSPLKFWVCVSPSFQVLDPCFQGGPSHAQAMYAWRETVNCSPDQPEPQIWGVSLFIGSMEGNSA